MEKVKEVFPNTLILHRNLKCTKGLDCRVYFLGIAIGLNYPIMKFKLLIWISSFSFLLLTSCQSCKSGIKGPLAVVQTDIRLKLKDQYGTDLLDSTYSGQFDWKRIKLFFLEEGQLKIPKEDRYPNGIPPGEISRYFTVDSFPDAWEPLLVIHCATVEEAFDRELESRIIVMRWTKEQQDTFEVFFENTFNSMTLESVLFNGDDIDDLPQDCPDPSKPFLCTPVVTVRL